VVAGHVVTGREERIQRASHACIHEGGDLFYEFIMMDYNVITRRPNVKSVAIETASKQKPPALSSRSPSSYPNSCDSDKLSFAAVGQEFSLLIA